MKEYKVIELRPGQKKDAENIMNEMAEQGWEVVSTSFWSFWWISLIITFSREKEQQ